MPKHVLRSCSIAFGLIGLLLIGLHLDSATAAGRTIPPVAPTLRNADFECAVGFDTVSNPAGEQIRIPTGWQVDFLEGAPETNSTRREVTRNCDQSSGQHIEKISQLDSWIIKAQDIESTAQPGKPFDLAFHQQVSATVGGAYSLSGWMVSLCGGSTTPNDCPDGYYMAKRLGIDPTGGVDPLASTVVWAEDRRNFVENGQRVGWSNLSLVAMAQAPTITVFARVESPFQWHGNHAFVDGLSLVRAPAATLPIPARLAGPTALITWTATQSPDVAAISGGNFVVYVDIQYRADPTEPWRDWVTGHLGAGSQPFTVTCLNTPYAFRIRARAEQPDDEPGVFPTQRYPGVWSEPVFVTFQTEAGPPPQPITNNFLHYLPLIGAYRQC